MFVCLKVHSGSLAVKKCAECEYLKRYCVCGKTCVFECLFNKLTNIFFIQISSC